MWLDVEVTAPPAAVPVTVEEARAQVNIEEGCADFDTELTIYMGAARGHAEELTGTRLITQSVTLRASSFRDLRHLPAAPLQSIASVKYLDSDGVEQTLASTVYEAVLVGMRPFVRLKAGQTWPSPLAVADTVRIAAVAGYGDDPADVPEDVRLAQLLMIADWFKNRESGSAVDMTRVPNAARALLEGHKRARGI